MQSLQAVSYTHLCIGKYVNPVTEGTFAMEDTPNIGESMVENPGIYCKSANVSVLAANGKTPLITLNQFGAGKAMYLSCLLYTSQRRNGSIKKHF